MWITYTTHVQSLIYIILISRMHGVSHLFYDLSNQGSNLTNCSKLPFMNSWAHGLNAWPFWGSVGHIWPFNLIQSIKFQPNILLIRFVNYRDEKSQLRDLNLSTHYYHFQKSPCSSSHWRSQWYLHPKSSMKDLVSAYIHISKKLNEAIV